MDLREGEDVNVGRRRMLSETKVTLKESYIGDTMKRSRKRRKINMRGFILLHRRRQGSDWSSLTHKESADLTLPEIAIRKPSTSRKESEGHIQSTVEPLPPINLEDDDIERVGSTSRSASELDTLTTGRMQRLMRRKELGAKFRRLAHFLTILFGLWKSHAKRVQHFMDTNVDLLDVQHPTDLLFDVTEYRADKQARVSQKTKRILKIRPEERTESESRHVQISLGNYPTIAEYPLRMTRLMAERAWYERYDAKRVIVRQGHPARCYYFILNGSVVVTRMEKADGLSRTVCFLKRGESFGDLGLVSNAPRQATVISKEPLELLVFGDNDYVDIFMSGGLRDSSDPFLNSLFFFKGWPLHLLPKNPNMALLNYFKRGMTLVHDSDLSDWLYIIKSGSCIILKKLKNVKPASRQIVSKPLNGLRLLPPIDHIDHEMLLERNLRLAELRSQQQSYHVRMAVCYELGIAMKPIAKPPPHVRRSLNPIQEVAKINEEVEKEFSSKSPPSGKSTKERPRRLSGPFISSSMPHVHEPTTPDHTEVAAHKLKAMTVMRHKAKKQRTKGKHGKKTISDELNVKFLTSDLRPTEADLNPAFVKIQTLTKGSAFGLSHLVHDDQPRFSLVSNGAECILINKKFYLDHVDKHLMNTLRMEVSPYPSAEELQSFLQVHVDWQYSKSSVLTESLGRNHSVKINVHDARAPLTAQQG